MFSMLHEGLITVNDFKKQPFNLQKKKDEPSQTSTWRPGACFVPPLASPPTNRCGGATGQGKLWRSGLCRQRSPGDLEGQAVFAGRFSGPKKTGSFCVVFSRESPNKSTDFQMKQSEFIDIWKDYIISNYFDGENCSSRTSSVEKPFRIPKTARFAESPMRVPFSIHVGVDNKDEARLSTSWSTINHSFRRLAPHVQPCKLKLVMNKSRSWCPFLQGAGLSQGRRNAVECSVWSYGATIAA